MGDRANDPSMHDEPTSEERHDFVNPDPLPTAGMVVNCGRCGKSMYDWVHRVAVDSIDSPLAVHHADGTPEGQWSYLPLHPFQGLVEAFMDPACAFEGCGFPERHPVHRPAGVDRYDQPVREVLHGVTVITADGTTTGDVMSDDSIRVNRGSDGIEGIYGVSEADELEIGLCPCGEGYRGHTPSEDAAWSALATAFDINIMSGSMSLTGAAILKDHRPLIEAAIAHGNLVIEAILRPMHELEDAEAEYIAARRRVEGLRSRLGRKPLGDRD